MADERLSEEIRNKSRDEIDTDELADRVAAIEARLDDSVPSSLHEELRQVMLGERRRAEQAERERDELQSVITALDGFLRPHQLNHRDVLKIVEELRAWRVVAEWLRETPWRELSYMSKRTMIVTELVDGKHKTIAEAHTIPDLATSLKPAGEFRETHGQQTCSRCACWTPDNGGICWRVGGHEFNQPGDTPRMRALYPWQPEEQRKLCPSFRIMKGRDDDRWHDEACRLATLDRSIKSIKYALRSAYEAGCAEQLEADAVVCGERALRYQKNLCSAIEGPDYPHRTEAKMHEATNCAAAIRAQDLSGQDGTEATRACLECGGSGVKNV